ncbi:MAG: DUF952 domain-containing protein [Actinomycetota bacterium]|nr:DUF952 domain-containing protein [Acidimicrobiia bacterium]MDQ3294781.1 DUF952 domain-containing protein [Actinomycetota bacterium]
MTSDPAPLFHLTSSREWKAASAAGAVVPAGFAEEGFVHCSTAGQIEGVFERYYADLADPVLLRVDPGALGALEVRWEGEPERFPHVYGPLPVAAVTAAADPWRPRDPLP